MYREKNAEALIVKYLLRNPGGSVYQSQLSKDLNIDSRVVSKVLVKLEKLGAVGREPVMYNSRKTFLLKPNREKLLELAEELGVSIFLEEAFKSVMDIPCMKCPHIDRCYEGGYHDPSTCTLLTNYLRSLVKESRPLKASPRGS